MFPDFKVPVFDLVLGVMNLLISFWGKYIVNVRASGTGKNSQRRSN